MNQARVVWVRCPESCPQEESELRARGAYYRNAKTDRYCLVQNQAAAIVTAEETALHFDRLADKSNLR